MKHRTWPDRSNGPPFSDATKLAGDPPPKPTSPIRPPGGSRDFSDLPRDVVARIAASFARKDVESASLVCTSWSGALRPMREAMRLLRRGKRLRRGGSGDLERALDAFLRGTARGSSLAMVDAGLVYWGRGEREEAVALYRRAVARRRLPPVQSGDFVLARSLVTFETTQSKRLVTPLKETLAASHSGHLLLTQAAYYVCRLSVNEEPEKDWSVWQLAQFRKVLTHAEPPKRKEAIRWLYLASMAGHTRAQYQLALSMHQDCGADCNLPEAARWYMKAAEGGHVGAMYNLSRFYSCGKGLAQNHRQARKWMKRAADRGHSKAQFDYGLTFFLKVI